MQAGAAPRKRGAKRSAAAPLEAAAAEEPEVRDSEEAALPLPGAEGVHGMAGGEEARLGCQDGPATPPAEATVTGEWRLIVWLS